MDLQLSAAPIRKRIVLIGGGHAHVTTLLSWGMRPEPGVGLTVIAKELDAPYSGMLPGYVAGHYDLDDCHIDLVRLAQFAGARLIHGEAIGIDRQSKRINLKGRPAISYDIASIDTGITPLLDDIRGAREFAIAVKPVSTFAPRWQALEARAWSGEGVRRFVVIGAGAAGFELILAIRYKLLSEAQRRGVNAADFHFTLVGNAKLLPSHNDRARRLAAAALAEARVEVILDDAATEVTPTSLRLASGRSLVADAVLVTTRAQPPAWFRDLDLSRDDRDFLAVRPTLQCMEDNDIFAVGDCATVMEHPREKAGVFAVRQGPPLTQNLRLRARGLAAEPFTPQRQFLTLLSLGDKSAIASRGPFAAAGDWAWRWKDHIDRAFMTRFNRLPVIEDSAADGEAPLFCAGCASKLGPQSLDDALARLDAPTHPPAIEDLAPGEDAAVLDLGAPALRLETADYFRALWPEPFVMGEITALHALSDVVAKGGTPDHALVIAQVPYGAAHLQEDDLFQLMSGARTVFDREGIAIVGGHSGQGTELAAGFFVSGTIERDKVLRKSTAQTGDVLILTKPLGTGILFAALMRRLARARYIAAALAGMRQSNAPASRILAAHAARAMTDITGFGLGGHLLEMLRPGHLCAVIDALALPLYPGVLELARDGVASTLLSANLAARSDIGGEAAAMQHVLAVFLDPQTSGGLLAAIPPDRAEACLAALRAAGIAATMIGTLEARPDPTQPKIMLRGQMS